MAEAIDLKSPEYLAERVLQLELEAEGHKQTISQLKQELSEREKIFDEQDAFIQRTNECLGHLAEGFHSPKEIAKAIDGDKLIGKHVSNNDIRHSALVDSHVYAINYLRGFGINEATLSMLCQLVLAVEELPPKLKDEFMFQISREKSPLPEGRQVQRRRQKSSGSR